MFSRSMNPGFPGFSREERASPAADGGADRASREGGGRLGGPSRAGGDRGGVAVIGARDRRAAAPGEERRGDRTAWTGEGDGLPEGAEAAGGASSLAQEKGGERRGGAHPGVCRHADRAAVGQPDVRDSARGGVDTEVRRGIAGDGGDRRGIAVERQ